LGIDAKQQSRIPQNQNELQMCRIGTTLAANPAASRSDDKMGYDSMPKTLRQAFRYAAASELLVVGVDNLLRDREKCCTLESTMSRRSATIPKMQSRRVAAWIYAVINPIVDALERELTIFDTENLTWRSNLRRCESIHSIQEYVDVGQWPNFRDFEAEHNLFLETFGQHDADLKLLNDSARQAFDWLISQPDFSQEIARLMEDYEAARSSVSPQVPRFTDSRPELSKMAAENVINNIPTLPVHYLFAPFWNLAAAHLLPFRNLPEFDSLHGARGKLRELSSGLKQGLEDQRLKFSRKFDIPAAPIPGLSLEI
jgi:hypothetical protein